ncbi:DUF932 domain-containing protein [Chroococcidiopsis sp.]|uniref:DUF932 domain-containing protein n=1 Tax=Chroococcidiopsis sp. TaxID=3088168 RepID=UPI003F4039A0
MSLTDRASESPVKTRRRGKSAAAAAILPSDPSRTVKLYDNTSESLAAFQGRSVWSVLGRKSQQPLTQVSDIVEQVLGWDVKLTPIPIQQGTEILYRKTGSRYIAIEVPKFTYDADADYVQVVRTDTGAAISYVKPSYELLTNYQALSWAQPLLDEGILKFSSIVELDKGKEIVTKFDAPHNTLNVGGEELTVSVVVRTSHEATSALTALLWVERPHGFAMLSTDRMVRCNHTLSVLEKLPEIRSALDLEADWLRTQYVQDLERMMRKPMSVEGFSHYLRRLFPEYLPPGKALEDWRCWEPYRTLFTSSTVFSNLEPSVYKAYSVVGFYLSQLSGGTKDRINYASRFKSCLAKYNTEAMRKAYTIGVELSR